jgi:hypothetical protein
MTALRRLVPGAALAAALVMGACSESTSPSAADPTALATAVNGMATTFSQNSVLQSLSALIGTPGLLPVMAAVSPSPLPRSGASWTQSAIKTRALMRELAAQRPAAVQALFPANVLGKTFQWDTTSPAGYRILDSTLTGAPSNGVRFRLYQVDTVTGEPSVPLLTTGYVDLQDASTAQANVLHLTLKVGTQTAADYVITEVRTTSSLSLNATGYLQDVVAAGTPVNFNLTNRLALADSSMTDNYQLNGNGATVSMVDTMSASGDTSSVNWQFSKNGSVQVLGRAESSTIDAQVKFNGTTFATVTGSQDNPTLAGANGGQLSVAELLALQHILVGFADIYFGSSLVFVPGLLIFG